MISTLWTKRYSLKLPFRVSIRLSILSILLLLLVSVSSIIIAINYFALNSVFISSAVDSLHSSSAEVSAKIGGHMQPLNNKAATVRRMFLSGFAKPENTVDFTKLMYSMIVDEENISGAFWGSAQGDLFWLDKNSDGTLLEQNFLRSEKEQKVVKKNYDDHGNLLSSEELPFDGTDPRIRPWYKQAVLKKDMTWAIYRFLPAGGNKRLMGISSVFPYYDKQGELLGVFGVDMLIGNISKYIDGITVTKNSDVFVMDDNHKIISVGDESHNLHKSESWPKLSDLEDPWIEASHKIYKATGDSSFIYKYDHKKYIANYEKIEEARGEYPWYVVVVSPVSDVIAPLRHSVMLSLLFAAITLLVGIILASIFSGSISHPIRKLAEDANSICQMKLDEVKERFSRVKEIAEMAKAFIKMRNALSSFQRYMPVALVEKLVASGVVAAVGGELKQLTVIFTDIRDFTQLSENLNPKEVMQDLSRYFQVITDVVSNMGGTVDKYIGDGAMAFWGAPTPDANHAEHACRAVLKIQKALKKLNEEWRLNNKPEFVTRIGINTGNVVVGNVGSGDRLNYTALGDSVNLASRLEGINKIYGSFVVVSEFTYAQVKDKFKFRLLDKVAAKGKKQGVFVYELLGEMTNEHDLELEEYNRKFQEAFSHYEKGSWQEAQTLFGSLYKAHPEDLVIKIFIDRCHTFAKNPPQDWSGVWMLTEK